MAEACNIEAFQNLPQLLPLQENFKHFSLSDSKSVYFYDIYKRYLEGFFEIFRKFFVIFRRFFENFRKDI